MTSKEQNQYKKEWYEKNKERIKEIQKEYKLKNRDRLKEKERETKLKHKYGITSNQYDAMLDEQKGLCAICSQPPTGRSKVLHVDHCHTTGKVRALLCGKCNMGIGLFSDNKELLMKASEYVNAYSSG